MMRSSGDSRGLTGRILAFVAALAVVLTGVLFATSSKAEALDGSAFNPAYIISDQNFFNPNTMSEAQIQSFLNSKVPSCTPGYTCLKDYAQATNTRAAGLCTEYVGSPSENAATIIYRVAHACGINPQVLLVTLQKEEALVTSTHPTAAVYQKAMGYGCSDTSACVALYYGFFNQVFDAAHQFLNYGNAPSHFSYNPGRVAIRYSPNAACGSSVVYIYNRATADLYDYTPYQPDNAALANLSGTGDACSSYGNRNFWVYYNNWFGSPTDPGFSSILNLYNSTGAELGPLGAITTATATYGTGEREDFANGSIFWSAGTGAFIVSGAELTAYLAAGGSSGTLGWPTSGIMTETVGGGGSGQVFQGGSIYATTSGAFIVSGAIRAAYWAAGGEASALGWPTGQQVVVPGGFSQSFAGGTIYWSQATGARVVAGNILASYTAAGGPSGSLGFPTTGLISEPKVGDGGSGQVFQNGSIYASTAGAYVVSGAIRTFYWAQGGEAGSLGWPTAAQVPTTSGGFTQTFQRGSISWDAATGAHLGLTAPFEAAYESAGGAPVLGLPTSAVMVEPSVHGGGSGQVFQGGSIYVSPAGGFAVTGAIRTAYWAAGGEAGSLAWPTGPQTAVAGGLSQTFTGGTIFWARTTGAQVVNGGELTTYVAAGGAAGPLGFPTSALILEPKTSGGGSGQVFQGGSIYLSSAGGFVVSGAIRSFYWAQGGEGAGLGWPTGAATVTPEGGLAQTFQGGTIIWSAASGARIALSATVQAAYDAAGGTSVLGNPISGIMVEPTIHGGGSGQVFQGGSIYVSPAGAFAVTGAFRAAYWSAGGEGGALAWPTGVQTTINAGLSQSFGGGAIYSATTSGARAVSGAEFTAYVAAGGTSGALGFPTSDLISEPKVSGGGSGQVFQNGSIYASAAGAFVVSGAIRTFYWAQGGETGLLGWPTSPATAAAGGGLTQSFQRGVINWTTAGGARIALTAAFQTAYDAAGGAPVLGNPTTGVIAEPMVNGGGSGQVFQSGSIYVSPAGGFAVTGAIRTAYWAAGGEAGPLAWPTGPQTAVAGGYSQSFTGGTIFWSASTKAKVVSGGELTTFTAAGGAAGTLGFPTSAVILEPAVNGGGSGQVFQSGSIYVSPAGGFVVAGAIRTFYWAQGGEAAALGWPTGAATAVAGGGLTQTFHGGTITWTPAGGAHLGG